MDKHGQLKEIKQWIASARNGEKVDWGYFSRCRDWLEVQLKDDKAEYFYLRAVADALRKLESLEVPISIIAKQAARVIQDSHKTTGKN